MNQNLGAATATAPLTAEPVIPEEAQPRWSAATRIGFRFAFSYFVLYMLPFPAEWLRLPWRDSNPNFLLRWYTAAGHAAVPWIAKHILHLAKEITIFSNGSGDTTYDWVSALCTLVSAVAITAIWSTADRKRVSYEKLHAWFRIALRFWLGSILVSYGAFKLFPAQFPSPYLARYFERYGDSSPMGILWTMMGASQGYTFFTGAIETVAGVLLFVPRLATLGALLGCAAMVNVFALNMAYDVPVKLYSFHLVVAALIVAAPDLRAMGDFFVRNRPATLWECGPRLNRTWAKRALLGAQLVFGMYVSAWMLVGAHRQASMYAQIPQKTPNYGIWQVDDFALDGKSRQPLTIDAERWQNLIIQGPNSIVVLPMTGTLNRCQVKADDMKKTLELTSTQPKWTAKLTYARQGETLTLEGTRDGKPVRVTLHRVDPQWLLKTRGFHWVNEFPFNR